MGPPRLYSDAERIERNRDSRRRYYLKNKAKVDADVYERRREQRCRNRRHLIEWKQNHPCKCGENHVACLSFHHLDAGLKEDAVYKLAKSPVSLDRLQAEIDKCIVVCENCHKKIHAKEWKKDAVPVPVPEYALGQKAYHAAHRTNARIASRIFVWRYRQEHPCKCGESDPACLEFHHLGDKDQQISYMVRNAVSVQRIKIEIAKCEILCSNCHRKEHYQDENCNLCES